MQEAPNKKKSQLILFIVMIALLLGAFGLGIYLFLENQKLRSDALNKDSKIRSLSDENSTLRGENRPNNQNETQTFTLDNNKVSLKASSTWTKDETFKPTLSGALIDAMRLIPGEKFRTIYGGGTEYFTINVSVYKNEKNLSPQEWLANDAGNPAGGIGLLTEKDQESNAKINGYSTYFRKVINNEYEEVHYAIASEGRIVYITARTYDTTPDLPGVGDFRKFESDINKLAQSVHIN